MGIQFPQQSSGSSQYLRVPAGWNPVFHVGARRNSGRLPGSFPGRVGGPMSGVFYKFASQGLRMVVN